MILIFKVSIKPEQNYKAVVSKPPIDDDFVYCGSEFFII